MNVEEWDRDFAAACLGSVNALLKDCGPSDFLARRSLESHRDELAARVASAEATGDTESTPEDDDAIWERVLAETTPEQFERLERLFAADEVTAECDARRRNLIADGSKILTPEESENDGRGGGADGMWSSKVTPEDR